MQCECCGRETDVLIEIGAVSPRGSVTGRCCSECCVLILAALEDRREEQPAERAEMVPVQNGQVFIDEDGSEISPREIRFGMKDHDGRIHYFCMRALRVIPEYEAFEIYPKGWKKSDDPERTAYCFRAFGSRKTDEELITELLLKLNNAMMNPLVEKHVMGQKTGRWRRRPFGSAARFRLSTERGPSAFAWTAGCLACDRGTILLVRQKACFIQLTLCFI